MNTKTHMKETVSCLAVVVTLGNNNTNTDNKQTFPTKVCLHLLNPLFLPCSHTRDYHHHRRRRQQYKGSLARLDSREQLLHTNTFSAEVDLERVKSTWKLRMKEEEE
ncbi:hypothetical protein Pmani_015503 [Petrolisthes manimaculis]|uniref:Uncharacterized protein n=1 Tax=Petrolisthes manimaculis TaxID=1843537 RepID=A0AAE1PUA3_9EUCA|nr:hypothetical protein Pmani_015503 [Petrolisthes manimaculis]